MNFLYWRQSASTARAVDSYGGQPTASSMNPRQAAHHTLSAIVCAIFASIVSQSFPNAFRILEVTSTPIGLYPSLPERAQA
ncbi:MAG: hypothetical protein DMG81_06035 [Acidobacteria bacterium]|nr:MAG: hypothetical protein DMG81_06035 [Acidobacteriota bacterium]